MKTSKNVLMYQRIREHGERLLLAFPKATARDPMTLCKRLRRLESQAHAIALRLCNGPEFEEGEVDELCDAIITKVEDLIGQRDCVRINRDPRGYALKVSEGKMNQKGWTFHRDWGGYGIIAPDFSEGTS